MGQKVNPISMRLTLNKRWKSIWFNKADYRSNLTTDLKVRDFIKKTLGMNAAIDRIDISRSRDQIKIDISTARPGVIIGRSGQGIVDLKAKLFRKLLNGSKPNQVQINIHEIRIPELSAELTGQSIANQINRRIAYRKAIKQAMEKTMQRGALGIKVQASGRLNGVEIARQEKFTRGSLPLANFRANIEYAQVNAPTTFGIIGIKVWLNKKEQDA